MPTAVLPLAVGPVRNQLLASIGDCVFIEKSAHAGVTVFLVSAALRAYIAKVPFVALRGRGFLQVSDATSIFAQLMSVIEDRKRERPEKSYTTKLFDGGVPKIGAKITEEAAEVVEAAGEPGEAGRTHTIAEAADLIYHLFVMLGYRDIPIGDVEAELARRFGISGLDEKAARGKQTGASDPPASSA